MFMAHRSAGGERLAGMRGAVEPKRGALLLLGDHRLAGAFGQAARDGRADGGVQVGVRCCSGAIVR